MPSFDRLTGLDSYFLHLERDAAHMHVAGCMVFDGTAPPYDELAEDLAQWTHGADPALRRRSTLWYLSSREDA